MPKPPKTPQQLDDSFHRALKKKIRGNYIPEGKLDDLADQIEAAGGKPKSGFGKKAVMQRGLDKEARSMAIDQLAEEYGQALSRDPSPSGRSSVYNKVADFAGDAANKIRNLELDNIGTESVDVLRANRGKADELTRMANAMSGIPRGAGNYALRNAEDVAKTASSMAKAAWGQRGAIAPELLTGMGGQVGGAALGLFDPFADHAEAPGGEAFRMIERDMAQGKPQPSPQEIDAIIQALSKKK